MTQPAGTEPVAQEGPLSGLMQCALQQLGVARRMAQVGSQCLDMLVDLLERGTEQGQSATEVVNGAIAGNASDGQ